MDRERERERPIEKGKRIVNQPLQLFQVSVHLAGLDEQVGVLPHLEASGILRLAVHNPLTLARPHTKNISRPHTIVYITFTSAKKNGMFISQILFMFFVCLCKKGKKL